MQNTAARLAAALSAAWKAKGASTALAAAITQMKAVTANTTARPLSPVVIDLEMEGWLIADSLSKEHAARNHIRPRGELIEIKESRFPRRPCCIQIVIARSSCDEAIQDLSSATVWIASL